MKDAPLVSFIIAAYNEELFIEECVLSCLNQTYKNIEVCVTDDGSTDNTWDILIQLNKAYSNLKIHKLESNMGKVSAFNRSFQMATGEYFALIGADDVCLPNRIETQVLFLNNGNYDLVFADSEIIGENGKPIFGKDINHKFPISKFDILQDNFVHGATLFMSKKFAVGIMPIPPQLLFEDWWFGFHAVFYGKLGFDNQKLIKYRLHANNSVGNDENYVEVKRKNLKRHFIYYDLFLNYLQAETPNSEFSVYIKFLSLNHNYKLAIQNNSLLSRLKLLYFSIPLCYPSKNNIKIFFKFIIVSILGINVLGKIRFTTKLKS